MAHSHENQRARQQARDRLARVDFRTQKAQAPIMQRAIEQRAIQLAEYLEFGLLPLHVVNRFRSALAVYDDEHAGHGAGSSSSDDDDDRPPDEPQGA